MDGFENRCLIRRVKSTPDPDTCEKVPRYTSHFYGILLQMYALPVADRSIYTTNLYHDTPPICIAILLQKYSGQGSLGHSQFKGLQFEDIPEGRMTHTIGPIIITLHHVIFQN